MMTSMRLFIQGLMIPCVYQSCLIIFILATSSLNWIYLDELVRKGNGARKGHGFLLLPQMGLRWGDDLLRFFSVHSWIIQSVFKLDPWPKSLVPIASEI